MSRFRISTVLIVTCLFGAVASAGVVGTYAVMGPLLANASAAASQAVPPANVGLPVRLSTVAHGTLGPATQATITFVHRGNIVTEASIGPEGTTQVGGLQTGPHSVFVGGPDGFAAFGSWLNPGAPVVGNPGSNIDVTLVAPQDVPAVEEIFSRYLETAPAGPGYASEGRYTIPGNQGFTPSRRDIIQGYGFEIGPDGFVHGRIVQAAPPTEPQVPLPGLDVYFIHAGEVVSQSRTGADGVFHADGLQAGVHSFVAAGPGTVLALGVDVSAVPQGVAARMTELPLGSQPVDEVALVEGESQTEPVALANGEVTVAYASPVFPGDLQFLLGQGFGLGPLGPPLPPGLGGAGGFTGGGGGFGGGGGGFGGGLGPLLGLAALGAAAALLADDDDDDNVISPAVL